MTTKTPTFAAHHSVGVQPGPDGAPRLAADDRDAQGNPSRVLQLLAEELGRMAARAILRTVDDPKTLELILGFGLIFFAIAVIPRTGAN